MNAYKFSLFYCFSLFFSFFLSLWTKPEQEVFCAMEIKVFYNGNCFTLFLLSALALLNHQGSSAFFQQNFINLECPKHRIESAWNNFHLFGEEFHYILFYVWNLFWWKVGRKKILPNRARISVFEREIIKISKLGENKSGFCIGQWNAFKRKLISNNILGSKKKPN